MQDQIEVITKPAEMSVNYEALVEAIKEETEKYAVVVTQDTVAEAKKLIQKLNKAKKTLDDRRKSSVEEATRPARQFDSKMKDLIALYSNGARDLRNQINRFEEEEKATILATLKEYQETLWNSLEIDQEFRKASVDDMALLGAVTPKGALKSATKKKVEARIDDDLDVQRTTQQRINELPQRSSDAGLRSPLNRNLVEHFLFAQTEKYEASLSKLIDSELGRQQEALDAVKEEIAQIEEKQSHTKPASPEQQETQVADIPLPSAPVKADSRPALSIPEAKNSSHEVTVDCSFAFTAPSGLGDEAIEKHLADALKKIGITAEATITVRRSNNAA